MSSFSPIIYLPLPPLWFTHNVLPNTTVILYLAWKCSPVTSPSASGSHLFWDNVIRCRYLWISHNNLIHFRLSISYSFITCWALGYIYKLINQQDATIAVSVHGQPGIEASLQIIQRGIQCRKLVWNVLYWLGGQRNKSVKGQLGEQRTN